MFCRVALWGLLCCWTPILAVAADDSSPVQVDLTPFAGSVEPIVMEPQSVPGAREPQPLPTVPVLKAHQRGRIFEFWWPRRRANTTPQTGDSQPNAGQESIVPSSTPASSG